MKCDFKEEGKRLFYGESEMINMSKSDNVPFAEIWTKTSSVFKMKYYNPDQSAIGLESYPNDFMKTKTFEYAALMPINTIEGLDEEKVYTLEPGKFIRFETTFEDLVNGFIPKVYGYIQENKLPVDFGFDYEEYPKEFDHNDPKSIVYVCFKYLGDE